MTTNVIGELTALVKDFQVKRLPEDHEKMANYEIAGRRVLYQQLAEAYRIGKILLMPENHGSLNNILEAHKLKAIKWKDGKPTVNPWHPVCQLMWGDWAQGTIFSVFKPDRAAEKYANVFRYLENHQIQQANAATFIEGFDGGLTGIVEADREERRKGKNKSNVANLATFLTLGCDPDEPDVVVMDRPDFVPEGAVFGKLWFKADGDELYVFGFNKLEEGQFNALATSRGRKIQAERDKQEAEIEEAEAA